MWLDDGMNNTHNTAAAASQCPARLLLITGEIVDGIFRYEPSTFVADETGKCFLVYNERADGVLLLRADHYKAA